MNDLDLTRIVDYETLKQREPVDLDPIYKLSIHEVMLIEFKSDNGFSSTVMRVAGGWIYRTYVKRAGALDTVFVPFDNEFQIDFPRKPRELPKR